MDVDHLLPFEALGVSTFGRDALQGVEEGVLGRPSRFAVAQQRGGVEEEGVEARQVGEGILLQGGDDVVGEVEGVERLQPQQRLVAHGLDGVAGQAEELQVLEVLEGGAAVSSTVWDSWLPSSRSSVSSGTSANESAALMWLIRLSRMSRWVMCSPWEMWCM